MEVYCVFHYHSDGCTFGCDTLVEIYLNEIDADLHVEREKSKMGEYDDIYYRKQTVKG